MKERKKGGQPDYDGGPAPQNVLLKIFLRLQRDRGEEGCAQELQAKQVIGFLIVY